VLVTGREALRSRGESIAEAAAMGLVKRGACWLWLANVSPAGLGCGGPTLITAGA